MASQDEQVNDIKQHLSGTWRETRTENMDSFYRELGLNFFMRLLASQMKPVMEILVDGTNIGVNWKTAVKTEVFKYKLNEEVGIQMHTGQFTVKTWYENGKLTTHQVPVAGSEAKPMITTREINDAGELVTTNFVGNVSSKRFFEKMQ